MLRSGSCWLIPYMAPLPVTYVERSVENGVDVIRDRLASFSGWANISAVHASRSAANFSTKPSPVCTMVSDRCMAGGN